MAEIRINATGGVKLYDADDSHYCQIVAGTISANVDILTLNSAGVTVADGAIDFDIASHDTSNGLKLGGTLVTATAAELNIMDGVTSTAAELNIMDGVGSTAAELTLLDGSAKSTSSITVADADGIIIIDGNTTKQIPASDLKTYAGFTVSSITGATALAITPASDDEMILSDAGTLKRMDMTHMMGTPCFFAYLSGDQTIATATETKITFDTESWDTGSTFASNKFTPAIAGKYVIHYSCGTASTIDDAEKISVIPFKNGSAINFGFHTDWSPATNSQLMFTSSVLVDLDTNDYMEIYVYHNEGGDIALNQYYTHFAGFRVVGA